MKRPLRVQVLMGLTSAVLLTVGCNAPKCGPGTKQVQATNGDLQCVPADAPGTAIQCDADAGAGIVGGICVSTVTCGPGTMLNPATNQCLSSGGPKAHTPTACPTPATGKICINGVVRHFTDNSFLDSGEMVRVRAFNPLAFLAAPSMTSPLPTTSGTADLNTDDTYLFSDITPPPFGGLVAVAVSDVAGTSPQVLQLTASGAEFVAGQSYQIDLYSTPHDVVTGWTAQSSGTTGADYDALGAYVMKFYADPAPPETMQTATEASPVPGVSVIVDGSPDTTARYFSTDFRTLADPSVMASSTVGAALIIGIAGDTTPSNYSGMGGNILWETHPGATTANVLFVDRFHPCPRDPGNPSQCLTQ